MTVSPLGGTPTVPRARRGLVAAALVPDGVSLLDRVEDACRAARRAGRLLAVVGTSWDDATEVTDVWGSAAVAPVVDELGARVCALRDDVALLHATPLGGTLCAVTADGPGGLEAAVATLAATVRQPVALGPGSGVRFRPVVTVAARTVAAADDPVEVLRDVRTTVSHARRLSPGTSRWHEPSLPPVGAARLRRAAEIGAALTTCPEQFGLAFQPVRDLATGRVVAAEALLRWTHPALGPQPTLVTVETAERSGLMPALGRVVLDGTLAAARRWPAHVTVHANVSVHELREPGYVDAVRDLLARHRVPSHRLLLELTESALATGPDSVVPVLDELVAAGVRLGLDDFGTGWSSIAQLRAAPVDTVKLDRSLVAGIAATPEEFELARAVLALVAATGRDVVAEGIETAVQLAHLRALGCHLGQGHHLGRPTPARALIVD